MEIETMEQLHATPVLVDRTSTNKLKFWQGFAVADGGKVYTYTEFWQEGAKRQRSVATEIEAKNVGRANETRPRDQAVLEIESECTRKQKKGYKVKDAAGATAPAAEAMQRHQERILPMLALSAVYPKRGHDIKWPCIGQPKLDGMRLVTDGHDFWSREGNLQNPENIEHLRLDIGGRLFDGEIVLPPDRFSFQDTMKAIKDRTNPDRHLLQFCVFDVIDLKAPYVDRLATVEQFLRDRPHRSWAPITSVELANEQEAVNFFLKCVEFGFEGIMLKNQAGKYRPVHRSADVQKLKPEDDDEFQIVGYKEGTGKDAGTPIWKCVCGPKHPSFDGSVPREGAVFDARAMGSFDHREDLWRRRDAIVAAGAMTTVLYQGFYDLKEGDKGGKPRFTRSKAIRDEK